ncbi:MAG TPA: thiamine pyrophosphate-dependent enzyme [Pirellulaceae bacterium]|jgi:thiamine pyrophosphate-dependent acetolactate synthase large subunit-like protein
MDVVAALELLIDKRKANQIVVTNQGSARVWPQLNDHALDFHYNPSTMGGAIPLALGLALAQPQREVLVVSGDGALLMSLGCLVTVVGAGVTNLTVVVLNNGLYEVTGGQKTPAADSSVDFASLAGAAGFPTALEFCDLDRWRAEAASSIASVGPRFISLVVQPTPQERLRFPTPPLMKQIGRLRQALLPG